VLVLRCCSSGLAICWSERSVISTPSQARERAGLSGLWVFGLHGYVLGSRGCRSAWSLGVIRISTKYVQVKRPSDTDSHPWVANRSHMGGCSEVVEVHS